MILQHYISYDFSMTAAVWILLLCIIQNVEQGKWFTVVMYVRSEGAVNVSVALTSSNGLQTLAATNFV